jgi:hypothetical protein
LGGPSPATPRGPLLPSRPRTPDERATGRRYGLLVLKPIRSKRDATTENNLDSLSALVGRHRIPDAAGTVRLLRSTARRLVDADEA